MSTHDTTLPENPSSIKTRFTVKFLEALKKMNRPSSMASDRHKRFRVIRAAAYASMASAVGSRRAWSRAVLRKIRNRTMGRSLRKKKRTNRKRGNPSSCGKRLDRERVNDLRGLVPGGEEMDFSKLLCETAHYIKCLRAKVQVMTNIVDHCEK